MSNIVVTELVVDARGAEQGTAAYERAMKVAQAAIDRMLDRDNAMRNAMEQTSIGMTTAAGTVTGAAKAWDKLRAAADPTVTMMKKIQQATLDADAAVRRGITTQAEADRVLEQYVQTQQASSAAGREAAREAQALAAAQEKAALAAARNAAALDDLRASHDAAYDASRRMAREVDELAQLESAGIQIAGGYAAALDRIIQKYDESAREAQAAAAAQEKATQVAARQAAVLDDLRASYDPIHDAQRRMARELDELATLESAGIQIAGGYAAALDRIVLKYDETAQAALKAKNAQEEMIRLAREDQNAANGKAKASAHQDAFNSVLGVRSEPSNPARDSAQVFEDEARAVAKLRAEINPLGAAYADLMAKIEAYEAMARRGSISNDELSLATRHAQKEFDDLAKKLPEIDGQAKLTGNQVQNLTFQLNDAFTMLLSGSSVFQVFATQGGQVAQALDGPNGVSGSLSAMKQTTVDWAKTVAATLGPGGMIVVGLTAAAGAAILFGTSAEDRLEKVNKAAESFAKTLADIRRSNAGLADTIEEISDKALKLSGADLRNKMRSDIETQRKAIEEARKGAAQASLFSDNLNPMNLVREFKGIVTGGPSSYGLTEITAGFLSGTKDAKTLRSELLALKATGNLPDYLKSAIDQVMEFAEGAIKAQGDIDGLTKGLDELRAKAAQLRFDDASKALAGLTPDVSEVEKVERAYRETMGRIAQLRGSDKQVDRDGLREAAGLQRAAALKELSRDAVRAAEEAQNRLNNLSLDPDQRSLAEIRQRYDAEIADLTRLNGSEEALAAKRKERDAAVSARQLELDRADNARKANYDIDLRATEARTAAEKAQIAADRERVSYLQQGYKEAEANEAGERARTLSLAEAKGQLTEALRQQGLATTRQIEQAQLEYDLVGKSAGETARLRAEFQLLAQAKDAARAAGFDDATVTLTASMKEQAAQIGQLTEATQRLNFERDLLFDRQQAFRSPEEQRIAEQLHAIGVEYDSTQGKIDAAQLRLNARLHETNDAIYAMRDAGKDALHEIVDALGSGEKAADSFLKAASNLFRQFASAGLDKLLKGLTGDGVSSGSGSIWSVLTGAGEKVSKLVGASAPAAVAASVATSTSRPDYVAQAAAAVSGQVMSYAGRFNSSVDTRLLKILNEASSRFDMKVEAISGLRPGDTRYHGKGLATDVQIYDASGKALGNYQDASTFRTYERFAQLSKQVQSELFPELEGMLRWGGYFSGGKGKYGALDTMHFDLAGNRVGMGGGSWENGLTDQQRRLWANAQSIGMSKAEFQRTISQGTTQGLKDAVRTTQGPESYGSGKFDPGSPGNPTGPRQLSGGQQALLGISGLIGAFSGGYESGSPLGGGLNGALGGFQVGSSLSFLGAAGGPIGAGIGLVAGILGGVLGKRKQKKQEEAEAKRQWEGMQPQYEGYRRYLSGEESGNLRTDFQNIQSQFNTLNAASWKAGNGDLVATARSFYSYVDKQLAEFREAFEGVAADLEAGAGLDGPFAKGKSAVKQLQKQLQGYLDDVAIAYYQADNGLQGGAPFAAADAAWKEQREAALSKARRAAQDQALSLLNPPKELSAVESNFRSLQGAAQQLLPTLQKLGMNATDAARRIGEELNKALAKMAADFVDGFGRKINNLTGKGYLNDVADLFTEFDTALSNASLLNVDPAIVNRWFSLSAQKIVDGSELAGDAFTELVRLFPRLSGVVTEAGRSISASTAEIDAAIKGYEDRLFEAQNAGNELAAFERRAAKERLEAAKFGTDAVASLEKTLSAERAATVLSTARSNLDRSYQHETDRINDLLSARRNEASELESTVNSLKSFASNIAQFKKSLLVDDSLSTLTPEARVAEARKQFLDIAAKAQAGDADAQAQLTGAGQEYLTEARSFYASSERYHDAFDEVRRILDQSEAAARGQLSTAESQLAALKRQIALDEAQLEQNKKDYEALLGINDGIKSLAVAMKEYAAAAAAARQQGITVPGTNPATTEPPRNGGWTYESATPYLAKNKDVAAAIAAGETFGLPKGYSAEVYASAHYGLFGQAEGRGWATGGYTGAGGVHDVAGVVHRGEVVWSQRDVASWGGPAVVDTMRMTRGMPTLNMQAAPRAIMTANDNSAVVAGLARLQASFESRFTTLAKATAQGAIEVKGSVDEGNRLTGRQSARDKRKAMAA